MSTLIVIAGYAGSGKTCLLEKLQKALPQAQSMNEGFVRPTNDQLAEERAAVLRHLQNRDAIAIVGSFECLSEDVRSALQGQVLESASDARFLWFFFENDLALANRNCERRKYGLGDGEAAHIEGLTRLNTGISPHYSIPNDAVMMKMYAVP